MAGRDWTSKSGWIWVDLVEMLVLAARGEPFSVAFVSLGPWR